MLLSNIPLVESSRINSEHKGKWISVNHVRFGGRCSRVSRYTGGTDRWVHGGRSFSIFERNKRLGDPVIGFMHSIEKLSR